MLTRRSQADAEGPALAQFTIARILSRQCSARRARLPQVRLLAYARYTKDGRYQLAIARPDGTHLRVLTSEPEKVEIGPTYWSRDGQRIMYGTYLQQGK